MPVSRSPDAQTERPGWPPRKWELPSWPESLTPSDVRAWIDREVEILRNTHAWLSEEQGWSGSAEETAQAKQWGHGCNRLLKLLFPTETFALPDAFRTRCTLEDMADEFGRIAKGLGTDKLQRQFVKRCRRICYRWLITTDGMLEPAPDHLPVGWESWDYPITGRPADFRQWLDLKVEQLRVFRKAGIVFGETGATALRDAQRLAPDVTGDIRGAIEANDFDGAIEYLKRCKTRIGETDRSEHVSAASETGKPDSSFGEGNGKPNVAAPHGWRPADEKVPEEFPCGPLVGTKKQLATWVLPPSGKQCDRALDTKVEAGDVFGRILGRYAREVWFRSQEQYAKANQRRVRDLGSG